MTTKIVYLIGTLDVGGSEGQLVALASGLDRSRFGVAVGCLTSDGPLSKRLRDQGILVEVIGFRGLRRGLNRQSLSQLPDVLRALARLVRFIRRESPDVVHGYLFWAYIFGAFAGRIARVPRVISSRRSLGNFKAGKRHYLYIERIANRLTDVIVANSEAVREDAIRQERLAPGKVIVIRNGVDVRRYDRGPNPLLRSSLDIPTSARLVGVIANFIPYKGHRYLFDAWPLVLERVPEAVALLIGDGVVRQDFEREAASRGFSGSLRFLGTRPDVPDLLALIDVVAHPSLEEGSSNAILEAMAARRPVVATKVGGNSEAIVDGVSGLLVPPADAKALGGAIARLLEHPEEARELGEAACRRVVECYGLDRTIAEHEELYGRLIGVKRGGVRVV